jgi:hypothetical protein
MGGLGSGIVKVITCTEESLERRMSTKGYDPCNDRTCCLGKHETKSPQSFTVYLVYDCNDTITLSVSLRSAEPGPT